MASFGNSARKLSQVSVSIKRKIIRILATKFSHNGKNRNKIANALSNALLSDIDTMFRKLLEVMYALYALFNNGVRHERGIGPHKFARDVHDRTRRCSTASNSQP